MSFMSFILYIMLIDRLSIITVFIITYYHKSILYKIIGINNIITILANN